DKSNEITALPELLQLLDVRHKVVTADAMGCQKEVAAAIRAQEGDYVLAVKDNQPGLHAEVRAAFATAETSPVPPAWWDATEDTGHGRQEQRAVRVLPAARYLSAEQRQAWLGLVTLVMVVRVVTCQATGAVSREVA